MTGGNKCEIRVETMHSAGALEPLLGIGTCASDELSGIAQTGRHVFISTACDLYECQNKGCLFQIRVTAEMASRPKVQSDERQAVVIALLPGVWLIVLMLCTVDVAVNLNSVYVVDHHYLF